MQRTEYWFRQRRGKLTASNLGQAVGMTPWGSPQALTAQLRLDQHPAEDADKPSDDPLLHKPTKKSNPALSWGTNKEPCGVLEYVTATGTHVEPTGFWTHADLDWMGGSSDGLLGSDGILEIKCPYSRRLYAEVPPYYYLQVNALMEITGREWADLFVWTPDAVKCWRIRRNALAFGHLCNYYANFFGSVASGVKPPNPSKELLPLVPEWIAADATLLELPDRLPQHQLE
jgi:putative phage-type endonuclease